ncbi:hypothetical protein [Litorimonas haliclonae]|uniref:hypothetical protein n=1 Tax=Litorimonas haliclonae TaxID=2081977 RepID=UPI0039EEC3EA
MPTPATPYWDWPENAHRRSRASIRQLSQKLRPSHFSIGGKSHRVLNPITGAMETKKIPATLVENDRQDHTRERREKLREDAK